MVLLKINAEIAKLPGVLKAGIMMGTERNKLILKEYGFWTEKMSEAGTGDMMICLVTSDPAAKDAALSKIESMAHERIHSGKNQYRFRSLESALTRLPGANLATISIPGDFAAREARKCLRNGLHVFLFSDNVTLEEEIELKKIALREDLLLMGPDCGTAIVNGVRLGFANVTRKGPVGIVGASGTGIAGPAVQHVIAGASVEIVVTVTSNQPVIVPDTPVRRGRGDRRPIRRVGKPH